MHDLTGELAMTDDTLPIVFKSKPLTGLVMLAIGAAIAAVGIVKITDDSFSYSMERWGPIEIDPQTSGWLMVAIGVPFAFVALVTVVRRCPTLTLDETGLLSNRCFGTPLHIPWSGLADVVIKHMVVPARGRTTPVDVLFLVTNEGKQIGVGPIGEPRDIAAAIERVAERMKKPEAPSPAAPNPA
jgi:hypothetical protein